MDQNNFNFNGFDPNFPASSNPNEANGGAGFGGFSVFNPAWFGGHQSWGYPVNNPYQLPFTHSQDYIAQEDDNVDDDLWQEENTEVNNDLQNAASRPSENPQSIDNTAGPAVPTSTPANLPSTTQATAEDHRTLDELKARAKASIRRVQTPTTPPMSAQAKPNPDAATMKATSNSPNTTEKLESNDSTLAGTLAKKESAVAKDINRSIDALFEEAKRSAASAAQSHTGATQSTPKPVKSNLNTPTKNFGSGPTHTTTDRSCNPSKGPALKIVKTPQKMVGRYTNALVSSPEEGEVIDSLDMEKSSPNKSSKLTVPAAIMKSPYDVDAEDVPVKSEPKFDKSTNTQAETSSPMVTKTSLKPETKASLPDSGNRPATRDSNRELRDAPPLVDRRPSGHGQVHRNRRQLNHHEEYENHRYREPLNRDRHDLEPRRPMTNENVIKNRSRLAAEYKQKNVSGDSEFRDIGKDNRAIQDASETKPNERIQGQTARPFDKSPEVALHPKDRETREATMSPDKDLKAWLEATGYYNEAYRSNHLSRHQKTLDLKRQIQALEMQDVEERTQITGATKPLATLSGVPKQEIKEEPVAHRPQTPAPPKRPRSDSDEERPYRRPTPRLNSPISPSHRYQSYRGVGTRGPYPGVRYDDRHNPNHSNSRHPMNREFSEPACEYPGSNYKGKQYDPHFHDKINAAKAAHYGNNHRGGYRNHRRSHSRSFRSP